MKRFLAGAIAFIQIMTLALPINAFAASEDKTAFYGTDGMTHTELDFSEIRFDGYAKEQMLDVVEEIRALSNDRKNADKVNALYDEIVNQFDIISTQYSLNQVNYYNDVTVSEYADIELEMSSMYREIADQALQALRDILKDSACKETLAAYINDDEIVEDILEYEDMTEREFELSVICDELEQQYNISSGTDYTALYKDKEWTDAEAYEAYLAKEISYEDYNAISLAVAMNRNAVEAEIYRQLVEAYNERARFEGYKNYAEYAYDLTYNRDYTTEDIKKVYKATKEYIVPMYQQLLTTIQSTLTYNLQEKLFYSYDISGEEVVELVAPYIRKVDPRLNEALNYLIDKHTYDMDISANKMGVGYTTTLYQYGMPFIFNSPDTSYYSLKTFIHEFGHYNEAYHNANHALLDPTNMDVAEIHSQGLEMLCFEYSEEIYGEDCAAIVELITLYEMLSSVVSGCLYDEFQNEIYAYEGTLTVPEINKIYKRISESYGNRYAEGQDQAYGWTTVSHTYQSPMYYISYATSALAALDILSVSLNDRQEAIDLYMEITKYGLATPYCELLEKVGMRDIFEEETIKAVAYDISAYSDEIYNSYINSDGYKARMRLGMFVFIGIIVAVLAIIALIIFLIVRAVRRSKARAINAEAESVTASYADTEILINGEKENIKNENDLTNS